LNIGKNMIKTIIMDTIKIFLFIIEINFFILNFIF
jgi:hypothetical protein